MKNHERYCRECHKPISEEAREDAKCCSASCRSNYKKKKDRLLAQVAPLTKDVATYKQSLGELGQTRERQTRELKAAEGRLATARKQLEQVQQYWASQMQKPLALGAIGGLSGWALYNQGSRTDKRQGKEESGSGTALKWLGALAGGASVWYCGKSIYQIERAASQALLPYQQAVKNSEADLDRTRSRLALSEKQLAENEKALNGKAREYRQFQQQHAQYLLPGYVPGKKRFVKKAGLHPNGLNASTIMNMEFETFQLEGSLGSFLGELNRQMLAIGLVGDPGAGKSTLSLAIAQQFEQAGYSVAYFSLEMGIGKTFQAGLHRFPIKDMKTFEEGDLEKVREAAATYDVVAIDSFGKTGGKQEDIDKLRNDFPETIFLFIFQKTTKGTSRGGAGVDYDCSMVIDVVIKDGKRTALMRKSRYGTQGQELVVEGMGEGS